MAARPDSRSVDPVPRRAPRVFIALTAAQKVKLTRALVRGGLDGGSDGESARACLLETRIEAAEISIGAASPGEAVIGCDRPPANRQGQSARHARRLKARQRGAMKRLHARIVENAAFAAS